MTKPRKLKQLKSGLPPFRELTDDEVLSLAAIGGINLDDKSDRFVEFASILESARDNYKNDLGLREFLMTDRQIDLQLREVRETASRLLELLRSANVQIQAMLLIDSLEPSPKRVSESLYADCKKAVSALGAHFDLALSCLEARTRQSPDMFAAPPGSRTGIHDLLLRLAMAWRFGRGHPTYDLPTGLKSPVIPFFRKGLLLIAQHDVGVEAARKWVRLISEEAAK